jgi:hypothetical protein
MANLVVPPKTLRIGVDEALYQNQPIGAGAVNTTGPMGTFAVPPQSSIWRAALLLQAVPRGGTVTTITFQFEISLDGGNTFGIYNKLGNFSTNPASLSAYSGISLLAPVMLDLSGFGGNGQMRLNFTTVTLGSGTGFDVYAHIG